VTINKKEILTLLEEGIFKTIMNTSHELNIDSYVVGGFVRDYILNKEIAKDIDILCIGSGINFAINVQNSIDSTKKINIYKRFGTAMLKWKDYTVEFVGARKESYSEDSRKPEVKSGTFLDDMNRRDFTINTLAISLNKENYGELIDTFNGIGDLNKGIIKTPTDSDKTFSDDPLRMLRAVRFSSQLNYKIERNTFQSIKRNINRIEILSGERISEELNKILMQDKPSNGFILLDKLNILKTILPELESLKGIEEVEGQTHKDNFYHTLEVVDNISSKTNNIWLRWAALLHDIGKSSTKRFNKEIGWTFHGHEFIGSKMVKQIFNRLKMPLNESMKYVQKIVMMSSRPVIIAKEIVTDSAVRRLIYDAGNSIDDLLTLCEADITTKNKKKFEEYHNNFKIVREKIKKVEEKDNIRNFQPPVTGEIIMKHFKIGPCKEVGIIKDEIKNAILDGEIENDYKSAFNLMKIKGKSLGL
jgi:putative nucleotidyltransferase with HDIG domain|tara:strand:- start:6584 stop:8005 length:1422 start_codon:yes stop_codon:yes gene_type:complete